MCIRDRSTWGGLQHRIFHSKLPNGMADFLRTQNIILKDFTEGTFHGHLKFEMPHGRGVFFWNQGDIYFGEWNHSKMNGVGEYHFADGGFIMGHFRDGIPHGLCRMLLSNHNVFYGYFNSGRISNKGLLYCHTTKSWKYNDFQAGEVQTLRTGEGNPLNIDMRPYIDNDELLSLLKAEKDELETRGKFTGVLFEGMKEGFGSFMYENGDRFKGVWSQDKPNGVGLKLLGSGTIECGYFKDGLLNGVGRIRYNNGDSYYGSVSMGLFHGTGVYFSAVARRWNYAIYENGRLRKIIIEDTRLPPPLYWEFLQSEEWITSAKNAEIARIDFEKLRQLNSNCSFFVNDTTIPALPVEQKEKEVGKAFRPEDYISVRELLRCSSKDLGATLLEEQGRSEMSSFAERGKSEDENRPSVILSSARKENSGRRGHGETNPQEDSRTLKRAMFEEQKEKDHPIIIEETTTLEAIESPHFAREQVEKTSMHTRNLSHNFEKVANEKSKQTSSSVSNFLSSKRLAKSKSVNRIGFSLTRPQQAIHSTVIGEVRNHSAGKNVRHVKSKSSTLMSEMSSSLIHDNLCESSHDDSNLLDKTRKISANLSRAWGDLYGRKKAERTSQKSCVLGTNTEDFNPNIVIKRNPSNKTLDDIANEKLWIRKFVKGGSVKPSVYSKEGQTKGGLPATSTSKVFNAAQAKAKDKAPIAKDVNYKFNNTKIFSLFKGQIKSLVRPKSIISLEELRMRDVASNGAKPNLNSSSNTNSRKFLHA
eukprot:TRINITY_DN5951_c0_g1_i18.p1 TRINITY_DN5951_c0_g1~~TRINITY_DN5951_c0_g1_i18.p1  ORF type:complete len:759 (+),score=184.55 TRINITY_DN5951_c0_g1_i18:65-2341(+)